jgi:O-antigen/teichoic acid export membrane protein
LRGYAAGLGQWNVIALERLIGAGTRLVAVAGLAIANRLTVTSATVTIAVTTIIGALAYLCLGHGRGAKWKASEGDRELRLMKFALGIWPGALVGTLLSRLDQTLLIGLSSVREIGLYVVAVSISEVTLVFNSAVRDVMFSNESEEQSSERLMKAARASTLMTVAASAVVALGCIWGIPILFGPDFSDAVSVTMVLLVGVVLGTPGSVAGAGLSARGRPGLRSCSLGVALVINIGVLVALSPALGAFGAAIATVAGNAIAGYANVIWMKLLWDMPISGFMTIRKSDAVELCRSIKGVASRWKHTPA